MSVFAIKFSGLEGLESTLLSQARLEGVKTVVAKNGTRLQQGAMFYAPHDTGFLRRSIKLNMQDAGLTADVRATAHYAAYVELGTRFMNAQPYMKPAFDQVKRHFVSDLKRIMR